MAQENNRKNWLPLVDYSNKYNVSISTLRRRIRGKAIQFKLDGGKYFLMDAPLKKNSRGRKPIESELPDFVESEKPMPSVKASKAPQVNKSVEDVAQNGSHIFSAAQSLVDEIKKAYSQVLHEKEEMILRMNEEITDLRTLVKVLENEIDRLNSRSS